MTFRYLRFSLSRSQLLISSHRPPLCSSSWSLVYVPSLSHSVLPSLQPYSKSATVSCWLLAPLSTQRPVLIPSLHHVSPTNPTWQCLLWSTVYSHTLAYNIHSPSWVILTQIQPHPHQLLSHKALSQLHACLWTSRPCLLYWASHWFII